MHVESLANKDLNNSDWSVLFFIHLDFFHSDEIKMILPIPEWEIDESLSKLEKMYIIYKKGNIYYSNVKK